MDSCDKNTGRISLRDKKYRLVFLRNGSRSHFFFGSRIIRARAFAGRKKDEMTLLIHGCDGSVRESCGLSAHISDTKHIEANGYRFVRLPLPSGDWGDDPGRLYTVRLADAKRGAYSKGECDVAEFCE